MAHWPKHWQLKLEFLGLICGDGRVFHTFYFFTEVYCTTFFISYNFMNLFTAVQQFEVMTVENRLYLILNGKNC